MKHAWAELFPHILKQEALFNIIKWMLIDSSLSEHFDFFFTKYLAMILLWLTSGNWVSYVNVFKPSLKILFLDLLPEEYFELTMVFGWKLTAKSWLLRCGQFLPLVLYWALNKASSNITLNLLNMGIMMMTGIFILWSCIQNIWWTSVNTTLIWNLTTKAYLKCLSHFRWNDLLVKVLSSWLKSETKRWNLGLTLRPAFLNKTRDKKDVISTSPRQDFLLHATNTPTNTHLPTIKVYQTTKITKLDLLSPLLVFKSRVTISELKSKNILSLAGDHISLTWAVDWFVNHSAT